MDIFLYLTVYEFIVALLMGLGALFFFIYAVISGMFKDVEAIKYKVYQLEVTDDE